MMRDACGDKASYYKRLIVALPETPLLSLNTIPNRSILYFKTSSQANRFLSSKIPINQSYDGP